VNLIIKTRPAGRRKEPVTVVVSKSVFKKAVERNLFKRRARSILTPLSKKLKADFWVIAKPSAAILSFSELKAEIMDQISNRR
jgi:ribonuclease P protein component